MTYAFRLRFRTAKPFKSDESRVTVPRDEHGSEFAIAATPDEPLNAANWLSVRINGFNSAETARERAFKIKDQLLLLGAIRYMGFDFGHDQTTTRIYDPLRSSLEENSGSRLRDNVHGLDVFEEDPEHETRFFSVNARISVTESPAHFVTFFQRIRAASLEFTKRQRIALELINDSLFPASPDAQLLIRVAAIETLCERGPRPEGQRALLSKLLGLLDALVPSTEDKKTIYQMLTREMKEPAGEACRKKVRALLCEPREQDLRLINRARNRLIHGGEGRGQIEQEAGTALSLAVDLTRADIGFV